MIVLIILSMTAGGDGDDGNGNNNNKEDKKSHCAPVDYDVLEYCVFGNQTFACTDNMTWCFDAEDRLKIIK